MKTPKALVGLCLALAVMAGIPAAAQDTGSANFTRFVALGDSLTASFISGGLVASSQDVGFAALVAEQAGVGNFEQPRVSEPGIPAILELKSLSPLSLGPKEGLGAPLNLTLPRPYDNLAVPGFNVGDVVRTVTGNPITDLILRGQGTALQQALALQPTFALLWIGNNDALGAATSGIVIDGVTLTPLDSFEADLRTIVGALRSAGAQLVMANIPEVTIIPFVNTLPPVLLNPATNQPVIINGQPVPLIGPNGPLGPGDKVLLLQGRVELSLGRGIPVALGGSGVPLSDSAVLDAGEVATIRARVQGYNSIIRTVAQEAGAALFDAAALLTRTATTGVAVAGTSIDADFLTGGAFSYDGVHPSSLGYAFLANGFIEAINETYGADLDPVNLAPFVFGTRGAGAPGSLGLLEVNTSELRFAPEADDNLREVLRVPPREVLERYKARLKGERVLGDPGSSVGGGVTSSPLKPKGFGSR